MSIYQGSKLMSGGGGGPSPYEIAKQNGYTGTEDEFNQLLAALDQNATKEEVEEAIGQIPVVDAYTKEETYSREEVNEALNDKASLDESGKIPAEQLPEISAVNIYEATIGTTWTEDNTTGVKSQTVSIAGITADNTAKIDCAFAGEKTSDGYTVFVEQQNQFLTYITNGFAETVDGGITFYIFGDAPTMEIPIVVEVV